MGREDLNELFEFLKSIQTSVDSLKENFGDLQRQLAIMEVNLDNLDAKVSKLNCADHNKAIRKAEDFILTHDTKEKALFGIRADIVAWISLIGLLFAIAANYVKITEAKVIDKPERQVTIK